jgi:hypothetical protein
MLTFDATSENWKNEHWFSHVKPPFGWSWTHHWNCEVGTYCLRSYPIGMFVNGYILRASPPMHSRTNFGWGKTFIMSICGKKMILNQHFHSFSTLAIIDQID